MNTPRAGGLHRNGAKPRAWRRRLWDRHARAEAQRLNERWPGWTVMYGPGSRVFYAMASWPVPQRLIVEASTADELEALMHQEEVAMVARRVAITHAEGEPGHP